jgi:hypothetical protein
MPLHPFRDLNVHASASHYAFTSPSNPNAQTLVIDRPSGDIRLNDGSLLGAKRVSSIAGILGVINLKLGEMTNGLYMMEVTNIVCLRQICHCRYKSTVDGQVTRPHGV